MSTDYCYAGTGDCSKLYGVEEWFYLPISYIVYIYNIYRDVQWVPKKKMKGKCFNYLAGDLGCLETVLGYLKIEHGY